MSAIWLMVAGIAMFVAAYFLYGGFLARKLGLDRNRVTPAHTRADGVDYVPAKPAVVLGHHFASIAGAAPIIGPVTALAFGWLPVYVWLVIGGIFMGAAHDFMAIVASLRHQGKSIGEVVEEHVGSTGKVLFLVFAWSALVLVIAVFAIVVAKTFVAVPEAATASLWFMVLAVLFGIAINRFKVPFLPATVVGVGLLFAGLVVGQMFPLTLSDDPDRAMKIWLWILFGYVFVASVTPVWALLQPRDYLNSYLLYAMLLLGLVGVVVYNPKIEYAAMTGFHNAKLGFLFPALFVTVACGAISGFHSLVGSGTTSKQIDRETDAKLVGYGGMLIESLLAILALVTVATMARADYAGFLGEGGGGPVAAFSAGLGTFIASLGIPKEVAVSFVALAVSAFALTSLDTGTRLCRFCFQEFFERRSGDSRKPSILATNRYLATSVGVGLAMALAFSGKWQQIWPIFGSANQLLAALALLAVSVWLAHRSRSTWFAIVPMVFMFAVTMTSLVTLGAKNLGDGANPLLGVVALGLFAVAYLLALQAGITLWATYRRTSRDPFKRAASPG